MKQWAIDRLKERTTWIGLVFLAASFGMTISPELKDAIIVAGTAIGGAIAVAVKES